MIRVKSNVRKKTQKRFVGQQVPYSQSLPYSKGLPPLQPRPATFFNKYPYQRPNLPFVKTPIKPFVHHHRPRPPPQPHHPQPHHPQPKPPTVAPLPVVHPSTIEQFEHHEGISKEVKEEVRSLPLLTPFIPSPPQRFPSVPRLIFSPLKKVKWSRVMI